MNAKGLWMGGSLVLLVGGRGALAQSMPIGSDSLLDRMIGTWTMVGTVRGKPARYSLTGVRVLQRKYVELHMTDLADAPAYEARVIIGQADKPGTYIAHWIDNLGAEFSVPPATGTLRGDTLFLDFPYPSGAFHDTFAYDRQSDRWTFRLEAAIGTGRWTLFAAYEVARVARTPP